MSASEKLKALERAERYPGERRDELEDALPQIAALVEAAEKVSDPEENELVLSGYQVFRDVQDALTALENALP